LWGTAELEEFRLRRIQQLQAEAVMKEQQQAKGVGHLTDIPEGLFMVGPQPGHMFVNVC
jgi:hypothetical protein